MVEVKTEMEVEVNVSRSYQNARLDEIEALLATDMTLTEIMAATGLGDSAARHYVDMLRDRGRAHAPDWRAGEFKTVRLFRAGPGEDAPKPPRPPSPSTYVPNGRGRGRRPARKAEPVTIAPDPIRMALFGR